MRILRRAASLLLHGRAYNAGRTTRLQGSFLRVPSGERELKLLRPGNTMEVSMATTNTAGEPEAFKYLKTSDSDERMEGSKKVSEDEEQALKVRFQEWMNKFNRNYKDEAEKAYRFEVFKSTVQYVEKFNAEQLLNLDQGPGVAVGCTGNLPCVL
ncbi:hypothetical protein OsJ_04422 [Oryza sativa Japonica Group]|uniref:Cathepsin propeptide inhibitor domain-containing protein n=1 Tax=Oryza sativa subsp. japonica TaxID=39947 RepID=B9EVD6_ORYSJ|nr:hypothetical protein OsJ_04422 [Oryza sativa Japonica Group]